MTLFFWLHLGTVLWALPHLTRRLRDPRSAAAWWLAILCLPVAGVLLYALFGWRRRLRPRPAASGGFSLEQLIGSGCGTVRREFGRVELLHDGRNAFSSLIAALQRARRSVEMEYYIICDDRIGRTVAALLMRRARAGVAVRVIYDAVGSRCLRPDFVRRMRQAGIDVRPFGPLRFPWFRPSSQRRNHRKIVIVDGCRALLGGINLARYYLDGNPQGRWRDEHLLIEGGAVADLRRLFAEDWRRAGGAPLPPAPPCPPIRQRCPLQIAWAGEGPSRHTLVDAFVSVILRAERDIRLCTPYFIPPPAILQALRCAAQGGVRVRAMVPADNGSGVLNRVAESYYDDLFACGVELYRYGEGFLHAKMLLVDERVASVGTANMDYRSLEENEEVTAFLHDRQLVRSLVETFDRDLRSCRRLLPEEWRPAGWSRLAGDLLRLTAPYL